MTEIARDCHGILKHYFYLGGTMGYEFRNNTDPLTVIKQLRATSEKQSERLAQALKEKNDLLASKEKGFERSRHYEDLLRRSQLDLSAAQQQLRDVKTHATLLLRGLGVL